MWYSHVNAELGTRLPGIDVKDTCQDATKDKLKYQIKKLDNTTG